MDKSERVTCAVGGRRSGKTNHILESVKKHKKEVEVAKRRRHESAAKIVDRANKMFNQVKKTCSTIGCDSGAPINSIGLCSVCHAIPERIEKAKNLALIAEEEDRVFKSESGYGDFA